MTFLSGEGFLPLKHGHPLARPKRGTTLDFARMDSVEPGSAKGVGFKLEKGKSWHSYTSILLKRESFKLISLSTANSLKFD